MSECLGGQDGSRSRAWPRGFIERVLRVASRTDTQGEVFLLPSHSFPSWWAGPRLPEHKEVPQGGRGSQEFQVGGFDGWGGRLLQKPVLPHWPFPTLFPSSGQGDAILCFPRDLGVGGEGGKRRVGDR